MYAINKSARKILETLIAGLKHPGDYRKIDNSKSFMVVHINFLTKVIEGNIYSISHTYIQEGDVMFDPEVCYIKIKDDYYPISYCQHNLGIDQECVIFENGKIMDIKPRLQKDIVSFSATWLSNIKEQQGIKIDTN